MEAILLESHYKFDRVGNMVTLLDVIDKEMTTSFLQDNAISTIVVVCTNSHHQGYSSSLEMI
jgi:hypothetical protein